MMAVFFPPENEGMSCEKGPFQKKKSSSNQHFFRTGEFFGGVLQIISCILYSFLVI